MGPPGHITACRCNMLSLADLQLTVSIDTRTSDEPVRSHHRLTLQHVKACRVAALCRNYVDNITAYSSLYRLTHGRPMSQPGHITACHCNMLSLADLQLTVSIDTRTSDEPARPHHHLTLQHVKPCRVAALLQLTLSIDTRTSDEPARPHHRLPLQHVKPCRVAALCRNYVDNITAYSSLYRLTHGCWMSQPDESYLCAL
ncbi:hypothetical protein J6590_053382 [Homalodisca vitripennis]|nr:hypothetical protein J6590_053382 [Homalodisca vitripennis]